MDSGVGLLKHAVWNARVFRGVRSCHTGAASQLRRRTTDHSRLNEAGEKVLQCPVTSTHQRPDGVRATLFGRSHL